MQIDSVSQPSLKWSDYLVGTALDEAEAAGDNLDISWPFADAQINAWAQVEAIWCVSCLPFLGPILTSK